MPARVPDRTAFRDHRFFLVLLVFNVVVTRIAMKLYGEPFVVLQHALSDLGATVTRNGFPNPRSPYVFVPQMVVSGLMTLRYATLVAQREGDPRAPRVRLLYLCSIGFFLMPAPHDLPVAHYIHMVGGGFIFFSLWMLTMIYLVEARRRGRALAFWVGMTILQATVLSYAFFFAIDHPQKQTAQGFGLVGLVATLTWITQSLARVPAGAADSVNYNDEDAATST
jgi:hypothetical membrane protein